MLGGQADEPADAFHEATQVRVSLTAPDRRSRQGAGGGSRVAAAIMSACEGLLATRSFGDLEISEVLAAAGVSRGTFYKYFSSKHAVLTSLAATAMEEMFRTNAPFLNENKSESPKVLLRHSLEAGWQVWKTHRAVMRAVWENWHAIPELRRVWLGIFERFSVALGAEIEREREAGLIASGPRGRDLAAMLLWASAQCAYVAGLEDETSMPDEDATLALVTEMWLGTLYGRRSSASSR